MTGFLNADDKRTSLLELRDKLSVRIYETALLCNIDPDSLDIANPQVSSVGLDATGAVRVLSLKTMCETYVAIEKKLGIRE